jgi:hypothetical protein
MPVAVQPPTPAGGIKSYYQAKIEAAELLINQKTQNLRRLEAQRNALNARGECCRLSPAFARFGSKVVVWFYFSASIEGGATTTS